MPAWATSVGVLSRVIPMKPTFTPPTVRIAVGGSTVRPPGRALHQTPYRGAPAGGVTVTPSL